MTGALSFQMVQLTPDLASLALAGPSEIPCNMGDSGDQNSKTNAVQFQTFSLEHHQSQQLRPIPKNFVWRLQGGRRSSSTSLTKPKAQAPKRQDMAVDVPVLRDSFDPWNQHQRDEDGGCKGCSKISKAKAVTRPRPPEAATLKQPSHVNGVDGECLDFYLYYEKTLYLLDSFGLYHVRHAFCNSPTFPRHFKTWMAPHLETPDHGDTSLWAILMAPFSGPSEQST